jgi:hypothetical protein
MYTIETAEGKRVNDSTLSQVIAAVVAQEIANNTGKPIFVRDSTQMEGGEQALVMYEPAKKADVKHWRTVSHYGVSFDNGNDVGVTLVSVQVGVAKRRWFVRTRDETGGPDECEMFERGVKTEKEAEEIVNDLVLSNEERDDDEDMDTFRERMRKLYGK